MKLKTCSKCGKERPIWKNVMTEEGRVRLCKGCAGLRSAQTNNASKSKQPKRKTIRPRSVKRSKQERLYLAKRTKFLAEHPHCEIAIPGICTSRSSEVHHTNGRDNDMLVDETFWKATCRACHQHTHLNPKEARELGNLI